MRRSGLALAIVLLASCNDWRDDYDFEWHGEHASVYGYGYTQEDVCGGSLAELDGQAERIKAELGIADSPRSVFRWIAADFSADLPGGACPSQANACAPFGEAFAPTLPHMHEVTHTIVKHIGTGGCPRLLDEGLSMYFDSAVASDWPTWEVSMTLREAMVIGYEWHTSFYINGMRLVSYLAETYGLKSVVQLCEVLPALPTIEQWDTAARETIGVTLEQLLADFDDYPQCTYSQMRAKLGRCQESPEIQLYAENETYTIESDCNDPKATNAGGGPGDAVLQRHLFVPWDMIVDIGVEAVSDRMGVEPAYLITECAACSKNPGVFVDVTSHPQSGNLHKLRAGHYEITVFFDRRDRVALRLWVFAVQEV